MRNWQWWKLYTRVKPLLTQARAEDDMKKQAEELEAAKVELEKLRKRQKELEEQNVTLLQQKNDAFLQLQAEGNTVGDLEEKLGLLVNQKGELEADNKELEERIKDLEGGSEELLEKQRKLEEKGHEQKKAIETLELTLQKAEQDKQTKDNQIKTLNEEMARQDENIGKLQKDKKNLDETIKKTQADLAAEEDKVNHLNKLKQKLEQTIDEVCNSVNSLAQSEKFLSLIHAPISHLAIIRCYFLSLFVPLCLKFLSQQNITFANRNAVVSTNSIYYCQNYVEIQKEESLEREKKVRADVEKAKRKLESDLKQTQEAVEELDRIKHELEDNVRRSVYSNCKFVLETLVRFNLLVPTWILSGLRVAGRECLWFRLHAQLPWKLCFFNGELMQWIGFPLKLSLLPIVCSDTVYNCLEIYSFCREPFSIHLEEVLCELLNVWKIALIWVKGIWVRQLPFWIKNSGIKRFP